MRGGLENLRPPSSLAGGVPPAFFGNDFTRGLIDAFDEVLAPVFASLDELDAYFDPRYAPEDFLRWMAGWLGFGVDERRSAERLREHLSDAREALLYRGTIAGVTAAVRACTGLTCEVTDSGGVAWSARPGGPLPGSARPQLTVQVTDPDGTLDRAMLDRVIAQAAPAHVRAEVIVTTARR
jgi:phage tail-like protein